MIQPGYYKHFKGGTYTVLFCAQDSTNGRDGYSGVAPRVVVYVSHQTGKVFVRALSEFTELVAWPPQMTKHPRFMRWEEPEA